VPPQACDVEIEQLPAQALPAASAGPVNSLHQRLEVRGWRLAKPFFELLADHIEVSTPAPDPLEVSQGAASALGARAIGLLSQHRERHSQASRGNAHPMQRLRLASQRTREMVIKPLHPLPKQPSRGVDDRVS